MNASTGIGIGLGALWGGKQLYDKMVANPDGYDDYIKGTRDTARGIPIENRRGLYGQVIGGMEQDVYGGTITPEQSASALKDMGASPQEIEYILNERAGVAQPQMVKF